MKYLFINSVAGFGSTGRIAAEQCRGLMAQGHECVLAFGREEANCSDIPTVRIGTPMDYRLHGAESRLLDDSGFGSRRATRRFLDWVREYDPESCFLTCAAAESPFSGRFTTAGASRVTVPILTMWAVTAGKPAATTAHRNALILQAFFWTTAGKITKKSGNCLRAFPM